jgi:hypothetical protein
MTNQHQATPDEWAQQEDWANRSAFSDSSCLIELRDRIEALEVGQQPPQDKLDRLIALDRDDPAEDAAQHAPLFTAEEVARIVAPTVKESLTDPAGSLMERVADAIGAADDEGLTNMTWSNHSRAAILEVTAWLTENYASNVDGPPPHQMLRDEVNR